MINIVHLDLYYSDQREITAVELKLKSFTDEKGGEALSGHLLNGTVSAAFFKTTLLTDAGQNLRITPDPDRGHVIDLKINLSKRDLTLEDITRFVNAFQEALDNTSLGF
jgi:hypothetical protein